MSKACNPVTLSERPETLQAVNPKAQTPNPKPQNLRPFGPLGLAFPEVSVRGRRLHPVLGLF